MIKVIMTKELARFLLDCVMYRRDHMTVDDPDFAKQAIAAAKLLSPIVNERQA